MAQCGGVLLGGDVVVGDVNAAVLVHPDHVVTELILVIPEVTLLCPTEKANKRPIGNVSSGKQPFS